ncbi:hypothetical protein Q5690_18825, partial [Microcoleus sp. F10-D1]|uniref:hypothetical protein n=1 Tax=Microcoleus sp. F10-D1 TaxID=2818758 RepID=UPI002FD76AAA
IPIIFPIAPHKTLWDVWKSPTTSWGMKNDSACQNKHHQTGFLGNKLDALRQYQRRVKTFFRIF